MNKRGVSAVVATVLIILITVASVTIFWGAIIPMTKGNLDFSSLEGKVSVLTSGGYTYYDSDTGIASVQIRRDQDDVIMKRITIIFSFVGDSVSSSVDAPEPGQTRVYLFDMDGRGKPDSVKVAPIFFVENEEKTGSVTSVGVIGKGKISGIESGVYVLGREYGKRSCLDLMNIVGNTADGIYEIDPDGFGGGEEPFEAYCDMTTDDGGWTLMFSSGDGGQLPDMFTTTTPNRNPTVGNVWTDMSVDNGVWYKHIRWAPSFNRGNDFSDVSFPVYNKQSNEVMEWFNAIGQGGAEFSPAVEFKCNWTHSWTSHDRTTNNYDGFRPEKFNIPNYTILNAVGNDAAPWDALLPNIHLNNHAISSDTHYFHTDATKDCNPSDDRTFFLQLWVR